MSTVRKILNLPDKKPEGGEHQAAAANEEAPFTAAASTGTDLTESGWNHGGWAQEAESSGRSFARRAGRVAIWAVIGLAAFTGVRSWVFPVKPPAVSPQTNSAAEARKKDVPTEEAQQVAARFGRSYMTWNSQTPRLRAQELAMDLPKGADTKMGWDGQGAQTVSQTIPGTVTQTGGKHARVVVDVRVSYTVREKKKSSVVSRWYGLEVPVAKARDRVLVSGQPALVGMPEAAPYTPKTEPEADSAMAGATRQTVKNFLTSWAAGSEDQTAAPGSHIAPLGHGLTLGSLDSWTVDTGSGDRRTGTAAVRWQIAGAQLQQSYRIALTQVSASSGTRWQVQQVTAES
ncbi:conjugal transfer protein [Streptomyces sp. NPDC015125]|uniref:conjugal transfer protein n=1 Tax=Streptomyces sp. NPDC015125 TaxID=3364938 RepID=UPI0036F5E763